MKKILIVLMAVSLIGSAAVASNFQEDLQKLAAENATNYISPFVTAFGTNMNNGLYHTAMPHKLFGFDIGVRVMGAMIPDDAMTYTFQVPSEIPYTDPNTGLSYTLDTATLYSGSNMEVPTVFGVDDPAPIVPSEDAVRQLLSDQSGGVLTPDQIPDNTVAEVIASGTIPVPPGINFDIAPLVMPQVSIGLPFKTEVLLRWAPTYDVPDIGEIKFFGVGLKHLISQYIPMCPVDVSVQYVYQKLEVGDILSSTHTCFNVQVSKKLSLLILSLTPYVGLGMESSDLKVDYTITGSGNPLIDGTPVKFTIDGDNGFRGRVGLSTRILIFKLYGDYSFLGDYSGYSAGLMISIM